MFSVPRAERIQILKFNGRNKGQGVIQVSGNRQGTLTPGNRLKEVQGIQVRDIPLVIQMPVNPPAIVPASNDLQAGHPAVRIQEATAEDVDLPHVSQVTSALKFSIWIIQ